MKVREPLFVSWSLQRPTESRDRHYKDRFSLGGREHTGFWAISQCFCGDCVSCGTNPCPVVDVPGKICCWFGEEFSRKCLKMEGERWRAGVVLCPSRNKGNIFGDKFSVLHMFSYSGVEEQSVATAGRDL